MKSREIIVQSASALENEDSRALLPTDHWDDSDCIRLLEHLVRSFEGKETLGSDLRSHFADVFSSVVSLLKLKKWSHAKSRLINGFGIKEHRAQSRLAEKKGSRINDIYWRLGLFDQYHVYNATACVIA